MSAGPGDLAGVAEQLAARARQLAERISADSSNAAPIPDPAVAASAESLDLTAVRLAKELRTLAGEALRLTIKAAHARGHTWQEIGDLLELSPQAASQRFGRATSGPAGAPRQLPVPVIPDAADRAITILADWFGERYDAVAATFEATMKANLPAAGLAAMRAQVTGTAGQYLRLADADPLVRQVGDYTLADVPMMFEAGLMKGRVAFDPTGRVAGLYVLPPATP